MTAFRTSHERPLAAVPTWILGVLAASLAAQIAWQASRALPVRAAADLPPAPTPQLLRLAALGEASAFARLAMVWLLAFDSRAGNPTPYQNLDYGRLTGWLDAILTLDPRSNYPLFAAARLYAENDDPDKARRMCEFVYARFADDPNRRWPLLAHAALIAKHRLHDLPLARRYASALQQQATDSNIPLWARQMEIFVLEDMNELDAAKVMLGGLLTTGKIGDAEERRFLQSRLEEIERRLKAMPEARPSAPSR